MTLRGDLGPLYGGGRVGDAVVAALPSTLWLVGLAVLVRVAVGTSLGCWRDRGHGGGPTGRSR